jgi:phytoene synthase
MPGLSYAGEELRAHDRDRFLLSLFAPARHRHGLWALYAFNQEIAKTREVVTDTTVGLMRLQWWRDAIAALYEGGTVPRHAIMDELQKTISVYDLPREHFDNVLYAREFDLEDVAPQDMNGLVNYADFTTTPLSALADQVVCGGRAPDEERMTILRNLSIGYSLTGLIRAAPVHAAQRRRYLPDATLREHGLSPGQLFARNGLEVCEAPMRDVLQQARDYLDAVQPRDTGRRHFRAMRHLARMHCHDLLGAATGELPVRMARPVPFRELRLAWRVYVL